jgi:hypothetical protein
MVWRGEREPEQNRNARMVDMRDTQIAGIVLARRATLATHFSDLKISIVDPWAAA